MNGGICRCLTTSTISGEMPAGAGMVRAPNVVTPGKIGGNSCEKEGAATAIVKAMLTDTARVLPSFIASLPINYCNMLVTGV